jgi:hypothetical protein
VKKPYREGMWFDVPLGDGQRAAAVLLRDRHHVLDIAAYTPDGTPAWSGSVSDRGLLVQRWRRIDALGSFTSPHHASTPRFLRTAHAERTIARACGVAVPKESTLHVYDLGRELDVDSALRQTQGDTGVVAQWRSPLRAPHMREIGVYLSSEIGAAVRLYADAVEDLGRIRAYNVRDLALGAIPTSLPQMPTVQRLELEVPMPLAQVAEAFPNLRSLRIAARDQTIDVGSLSSLEYLRALDCSHVAIENWHAFAELTRLRALRIARIVDMRSVVPLLELPLETLSLEEQTSLDSLEPLVQMWTLEQIELRGLWQFNVDEMAWLYALPRLKRVTVDIGGRRKNAELYRRADWACAWPFYLTAA